MSTAEHGSIAVVGIGCRFGGGIDSAESMWRMLTEGRDVVGEVPAERWDVEPFFDPQPGVPGKTLSRWGSFIDDVTGFEPEFFGITDREAELIDPQFRLLLETSCEALEHAGYAPHGVGGSATAVMVGCSYEDYMDMMDFDRGLRSPDAAHGIIGTTRFTASSRISYLLDLRGPAITLDTACSSSLVAVHLAAQALHAGEADMALAGGVMLSLQAKNTLVFSTLGVLSPTGRCHAFDAAGDGYVRGEGCGMVVLKRLSDAVAAGDRVLAVLHGTGINNNGRSDTMLSPSIEGQQALHQLVLDRAGVEPAQVGLIETHGPGTAVGDPIEFAALAAVYGEGRMPCALGSVKTNIGHCETAAGIAGLIKAVLAVRHAQIPPNLHFVSWNPEIDPRDGRLFVPTTLMPWPHASGPRLAAVSSYGMSGTNAHVVVGQAPEGPGGERDMDDSAETPILYPLSAGSTEALAATSADIATWLTGSGATAALGDVAHTLAHKREHRSARAVVAARDRAELVDRLRAFAVGEPDAQTWVGVALRQRLGSVWLFSGQGSQWAGMGSDLLSSEPAFAATVADLEPIVSAESGFSVRAAMTADEVVTGFATVQPTLFTVQVALAAAWRARGLVPAAVIGHSMGEVAAAVVAGALSPADGAAIICRRSQLLGALGSKGAMAQVGLPAAQIEDELRAAGITDVTVAAWTSPSSTVISGDHARVHELVAAWQAHDVMAAPIAVDVASHSPQVDPVLPSLYEGLTGLTPRASTVPFYSTVLEDPRGTCAFDAGYWADNLRRPVRFSAACAAALADGFRSFVEVSPHPLLIHAVSDNATHAGRTIVTLPTLVRGQASPLGLLPQVATAYCAGVQPSWAEHAEGRLVEVPLAAWARRRLWMPENMRRQDEPTTPGRPLLGVHIRLPDDGMGEQHMWQADVGTAAYPWLLDHQVYGVPAMPGAGYAELAWAVAADLFGPQSPCEIRDLSFHTMLNLDQHTTVTTRAVRDTADIATVEILADGDDEVLRLASATVHRIDTVPVAAALDMPVMQSAQQPAASTDAVYETGRKKGIRHGPNFAGMSEIHRPDSEQGTIVARVRLPITLRAFANDFAVHPVLLDLCLQTMGAHPDILRSRTAFLPLGMGVVRRLANPDLARWCCARIHLVGETGARADIDLLAEDGTVLVQIIDARIGATAHVATADDRLLAVEWDRSPLAPAPARTADNWAVCAEDTEDALAQALAGRLIDAGAHCTITATPLTDAGTFASPGDREFRPDRVVLLCPAASHTQTIAGIERARRRVRRVVELVRGLVEDGEQRPARLYVVTRGAQSPTGSCSVNLEQAALLGLCRVLAGEHPQLRTTYIDLPAAAHDPTALMSEFLADTDEDEVVWRDTERYVARLRPSPLQDSERRDTLVDFGSDGVALTIRQRGDLDSIELVTRPRRSPSAGEIEIGVQATGLNFTDVLNALGTLPAGDTGLPDLGYDCAGVITAVGEGVADLRVGDHVAAFTAGALASFVTTAAERVFRVPDSMSLVDAATLPTVYLTAWYALHHLAHLQPGEHILIHSATGGLGSAAVALARAEGAVIHATAGTTEKRDRLLDSGIDYVYDSRTLDFADQIRRVTDGRGIDVVLNSLAGAALRAGVELLRPGGRFIEVGRRDIHADTRLGLAPFRRNLTFASADLAFIGAHMPALIARLTREIEAEVAKGRIRPIPSSTYPVPEVRTALRMMAAAAHTGKLVITHAREGIGRAVIPADQFPVVRERGAYIITGGLGGLGLLLAKHLSVNGAGRIILNGRSRPSPHASATIAELRRAGTQIDIVTADITDPGTATRLVDAATATGLTLRGIAHAAAVILDATITRIDDDLLNRVWSAKVLGAWHLDEASIAHRLDWWLGFSSAAALVGNPGQGAYSAANAWLDAFAMYRRGQGRTAHSIQWGAWAERGKGSALAEQGFTMITPVEGLAACELVLRHDRPCTGYLAFDDAKRFIGERVHTTPYFAALATRDIANSDCTADSGEFHTAIMAADLHTRSKLIAEFLLDRLGIVLRRGRHAIDPDNPLTESGLDSLMALELRNHIDQVLGVHIPVKVIWKYATVTALAELLTERLDATDRTARAELDTP
ncbi:type I polyketide synthase [Nocardia brasiliensis]